ncbi:P-loop containing nucleoside triphosphate hydrolase protein [Rhodocollybia butyracea]|uniref:DNA 3'-5' helicase n=1 Tax=Rhodocollybia butyracea TaxID=206335 RepID=A0A9P5PB07_9AGAR|nr:P-loop containing nucleoside triphosphate hydrolase protein [Rhodocollybia butyracea]
MTLPRNASHKNAYGKEKRSQLKKNTTEEIPTKALTQKELESLDDNIKQQVHQDFVLKDFQRAATRAQLQRKDTLVHAHTGAGKTAIVAAPHAHPKSKGKVTFLVSPLIALQDEQAEAFRDEYHLSAIAINSSHGGLTAKNMEYQIVVISPEMMLTKRFTKQVIKNKHLTQRVLSIVIDEAHVISHWGSGFRKKYGELGVLRTLLPNGVPFVALSATLPSRVRDDILTKLQFSQEENGFVDINIGNDRPNVSLVARAIQHPMNTFKDLDFVIPPNITQVKDIPKTFIYSDDIPSGPEIVDHLEKLLPKDLQGLGIIRPFSAVFSRKYRQAVMKQFKAGTVRVLVCTDAAGMGCNIPDIDVVVQWKLPGTLSMFIQRAGRAARARGRKGLAVLLVERSAYALDCERLVEVAEIKSSEGDASKYKGRGKGKGKAYKGNRARTTGEYMKGTAKNFAQSRGANRGSCDGKFDIHPQKGWNPSVDQRSKDEGLLSFVQTGCCRRQILTRVYANKTPGLDCCDICVPELLSRTRPGKHKAQARATPINKGEPHKPTIKKLYQWRAAVWKDHHSLAIWPASSILSNAHAQLLASVGSLPSFERLKQLVGIQWGWWDKYGDSLWQMLEGLEIPFVPIGNSTFIDIHGQFKLHYDTAVN